MEDVDRNAMAMAVGSRGQQEAITPSHIQVMREFKKGLGVRQTFPQSGACWSDHTSRDLFKHREQGSSKAESRKLRISCLHSVATKT